MTHFKKKATVCLVRPFDGVIYNTGLQINQQSDQLASKSPSFSFSDMSSSFKSYENHKRSSENNIIDDKSNASPNNNMSAIYSSKSFLKRIVSWETRRTPRLSISLKKINLPNKSFWITRMQYLIYSPLRFWVFYRLT